VKRTPRKWTEVCKTCNGSGKTHHREHFNLSTPEESGHELDVPEDSLVCDVIGGCPSIFECCKEAASMAGTFKRPVAFQFNQTVAVVRPGQDPTEAAKTWWQTEYGRSYEESMRDR
jgi:hypothetical protein